MQPERVSWNSLTVWGGGACPAGWTSAVVDGRESIEATMLDVCSAGYSELLVFGSLTITPAPKLPPPLPPPQPSPPLPASPLPSAPTATSEEVGFVRRISLTIVIAVTLQDFHEDAQAAFKARLSAQLDGVSPANITLQVSAASVRVTATIATSSASVADAALDELTSLTSSTEALSAVLGLTVLEVLAPPTVGIESQLPPPQPSSPAPQKVETIGQRINRFLDFAFSMAKLYSIPIIIGATALVMIIFAIASYGTPINSMQWGYPWQSYGRTVLYMTLASSNFDFFGDLLYFIVNIAEGGYQHISLAAVSFAAFLLPAVVCALLDGFVRKFYCTGKRIATKLRRRIVRDNHTGRRVTSSLQEYLVWLLAWLLLSFLVLLLLVFWSAALVITLVLGVNMKLFALPGFLRFYQRLLSFDSKLQPGTDDQVIALNEALFFELTLESVPQICVVIINEQLTPGPWPFLAGVALGGSCFFLTCLLWKFGDRIIRKGFWEGMRVPVLACDEAQSDTLRAFIRHTTGPREVDILQTPSTGGAVTAMTTSRNQVVVLAGQSTEAAIEGIALPGYNTASSVNMGVSLPLTEAWEAIPQEAAEYASNGYNVASSVDIRVALPFPVAQEATPQEVAEYASSQNTFVHQQFGLARSTANLTNNTADDANVETPSSSRGSPSPQRKRSSSSAAPSAHLSSSTSSKIASEDQGSGVGINSGEPEGFGQGQEDHDEVEDSKLPHAPDRLSASDEAMRQQAATPIRPALARAREHRRLKNHGSSIREPIPASATDHANAEADTYV